MFQLFLLQQVLVANVIFAWTDWDQRQRCEPSYGIHRPSSVAEIVQLVQVASLTQVQVKVVGSGHSFSQITLTDDGRRNGSIMLNLDQLDAVIKLPTPKDLSVTVEAGMRVHVLNEKLLQAG